MCCLRRGSASGVRACSEPHQEPRKCGYKRCRQRECGPRRARHKRKRCADITTRCTPYTAHQSPEERTERERTASPQKRRMQVPRRAPDHGKNKGQASAERAEKRTLRSRLDRQYRHNDRTSQQPTRTACPPPVVRRHPATQAPPRSLRQAAPHLHSALCATQNEAMSDPRFAIDACHSSKPKPPKQASTKRS